MCPRTCTTFIYLPVYITSCANSVSDSSSTLSPAPQLASSTGQGHSPCLIPASSVHQAPNPIVLCSNILLISYNHEQISTVPRRFQQLRCHNRCRIRYDHASTSPKCWILYHSRTTYRKGGLVRSRG